MNKQINDKQIDVNAKALKGGLIGFMVSGTFLTQAFTWPIYIILALTIALEKLVIDKQRESSHE